MILLVPMSLRVLCQEKLINFFCRSISAAARNFFLSYHVTKHCTCAVRIFSSSRKRTETSSDGGKMVVWFFEFIWLFWILTSSEARYTHTRKIQGSQIVIFLVYFAVINDNNFFA